MSLNVLLGGNSTAQMQLFLLLNQQSNDTILCGKVKNVFVIGTIVKLFVYEQQNHALKGKFGNKVGRYLH